MLDTSDCGNFIEEKLTSKRTHPLISLFLSQVFIVRRVRFCLGLSNRLDGSIEPVSLVNVRKVRERIL